MCLRHIRLRYILGVWILACLVISFDLNVACHQHPQEISHLIPISLITPAVYRTWEWRSSRPSLFEAVELQQYPLVPICPPDALSVWMVPTLSSEKGGIFYTDALLTCILPYDNVL